MVAIVQLVNVLRLLCGCYSSLVNVLRILCGCYGSWLMY